MRGGCYSNMYRGRHISMEDLEGTLPPNESIKAITQAGSPPWNPNDPNKNINVFVYGSLLSGFGNNYILKTGECECLGKFTTKKRYYMVGYGGFPAVCKAVPVEDVDNTPSYNAATRSIYRPVLGEIYKVDLAMLARLDRLEGNGHFYKREIVPIKGFDGRVWMYILMWPDKQSPLGS